MKVVFLCPYPFDEAPSQRYRFELFFDSLNEKAIEYKQCSFWTLGAWRILYDRRGTLKKSLFLFFGFLRRFKHVFVDSRGADVVFVHRELTPIGPPIFEWMLRNIVGIKYVYDFDDAIWMDDKVKKSIIHGFIKSKSKIKKVVKWAEKISAGNSYLADYARQFNPNVIILPTVVDHNVYQFKEKKDEKLVIGWTGTHTTLPYLEPVLPIIQKICIEKNVKFQIIANQRPSFNFSGLEYLEWNKVTAAEDLSNFDIGIMPLSNDEWVKGKCGFKAIQYMALGIPPVVSNVGVNSEIVNHERNGFLCDKIEDWERNLNLLIDDHTLRKKIGIEASEKILKDYSTQAQFNVFYSLLN